MKDIKAARYAYNDGIIDAIIWVRRKCNPANAMTKHIIVPELFQAVEEGNLHYEVEK